MSEQFTRRMEQFHAEVDAVYAGRPFSRMPRSHIHNFVKWITG